MKRFMITMTCVIICTMCFSLSAFAAKEIKIIVKNTQLRPDSAPVIIQGRVMVPLRAVSEALGASVEWNKQTKTAAISKWSQKTWLTVGKKTALVTYGLFEPEEVPLNTSVKSLSNRVYVPLRFIAEQFGYNVNYANNTVSIQSPLNEAQRAKLYSGDLSVSRQIAIDTAYNGRNYRHTPLKTLHPYLDYSTAFLFPEGEALRFFVIEGDETITLFEYEDDFLVATWQAHFEEIGLDVFQQLIGDRLKDRTGPTPKIGKPFLYYLENPFGGSNRKESGHIDTDGSYTLIGYNNQSGGGPIEEFGTVSLVLPNEVRKESLEIPHN